MYRLVLILRQRIEWHFLFKAGLHFCSRDTTTVKIIWNYCRHIVHSFKCAWHIDTWWGCTAFTFLETVKISVFNWSWKGALMWSNSFSDRMHDRRRQEEGELKQSLNVVKLFVACLSWGVWCSCSSIVRHKRALRFDVTSSSHELGLTDM